MNQKILTSDFIPKKEFLEFLSLFNIKHSGTLDSIVESTQKAWLNIDKKITNIDEKYYLQSAQILKHADRLGLIKKVSPNNKQFDYAIILGSDLNETRMRLAHLIYLWQTGTTFSSITCLGSERSLDQITESDANLLNSRNGILEFKTGWTSSRELPTTEYEMMQWVFVQSNIPLELRKLPIHFINAPIKNLNDGASTQPNTADTINKWLQLKPEPGNCLFISNQPFIEYQKSVVKTIMPSEFGKLEVCGPSQSNFDSYEILDTLARFLYQEKIRRDKK
jgi:hypothetical protein